MNFNHPYLKLQSYFIESLMGAVVSALLEYPHTAQNVANTASLYVGSEHRGPDLGCATSMLSSSE